MTDVHTGNLEEYSAVQSLERVASVEQEQTNMENQAVDPVQPSRLLFFTDILLRLHLRQAIMLRQSEDEEDSETSGKRMLRWRRKHLLLGCIILTIVLLAAILPPIIVHAVRQKKRSRRPTMRVGNPYPRSCARSVPWYFGAETLPTPASFLGLTYRYTANATMSLSASADMLDLVTQEYWMNYAHGPVEFLVNDDRKYSGSRDVHVEFVAFMDDREDLRYGATLCHLHPAPKSDGAVLMMSYPRYGGGSSRRMGFLVKVIFPPLEGSPLHIKRFQTNMPRFIHNVGDLCDCLFFEHIALRTIDNPVHVQASNLAFHPCCCYQHISVLVQSLKGGTLQIITSNGFIKGSVDAVSSVSLQTQNAPIEVDVRVAMSDVGKRGVTSIQTTNAYVISMLHISANVSLLAQGEDTAFTTTVRTTNAALDVTFPEIPPDSLLDMHASTTNAPAIVHMPKTFKGYFNLMSSNWH
ncbi:uncharacterized protein FIBRA_08516 [Fibroporia radiculosa]|uniref:Uncharacterized protein n=1 Tax=Fibroporia radiculosa TaxID=599839 RepID=J4ICE4_9APHY|nr:uncharacterized protein FIBRA_08516 [Fibroporia radiculosa]CCM06266.1 predicted protein [Fibroporia radiculosa]